MNKKPTLLKILIYISISIILLITFICAWVLIEIKWQLFFYLTFWSFWLNEFYITTLTICDSFEFFNIFYSKTITIIQNFLRNNFLNLIFPFSFAICLLFWLLVILGDEFQAMDGIKETLIAILLHGIIFIFIIIDIIFYKHVIKPKKIFFDIFLIPIIFVFYLILLLIGKYCLNFDTYDFMIYCRFNHLIVCAILIYIVILNGYAIFHLIGFYFFEKDGIREKEKKNDDVVIYKDYGNVFNNNNDDKKNINEEINGIEIR